LLDVPAVLSWLLVSALLSPSSPVPSSCPCCHVLTVLSICLVMAVLSWMSCPSCHVLAVMSWPSCCLCLPCLTCSG
jgi:hypothetical protein